MRVINLLNKRKNEIKTDKYQWQKCGTCEVSTVKIIVIDEQ